MGASTLFLLVVSLLVNALAAPQQPKANEVTILEQENNFNGVDPWRWSFKTSDGQSHEESGVLTPDGESVALQGGYTWTSPEGDTFSVSYTADDDRGFVAQVTRVGAGGQTVSQFPRVAAAQPSGDNVLRPAFGPTNNRPSVIG